jgi:asparagine synthase (glutamine-hydrolysing)
MCGIFGVWNFKDVNGHTLRKVSSMLRHRGPDDEGFLVIQNGHALSFGGNDTKLNEVDELPESLSTPNALLHRRLSIQDLSAAGHQPMRHALREIYLSFNGEIYNFKDLRKQYNLSTKTGTDSEVILALYAKIGEEAFSKFRGMWAIALLDLERNKLILSRDRFGIKPLYYIQRGKEFAFSSEVKPLLALPRSHPEWSREKLVQFLTFGTTSDKDETFFSGISSLKAGHNLILDLDTLQGEESTYYDLPSRIKKSEFIEGSFQDYFTSSIREHLVSDLEVGSCLSGGLDSSLIVAEACPSVKQSFTCAFKGFEIDESRFALQLKSACPDLEQHFTHPEAEDFYHSFDNLIQIQERPIGSASVFAQYAVMKLARQSGIHVLLDGQGADEVLGGYYPFAGAYLLGILKSGQLMRFKKELQALKENFNPRMEQAMLRAFYYQLPRAAQIYARRKNRLGYDLVSKNYQSVAARLESPLRGASGFAELAVNSISFGLLELLHYEDRNSMHFSIESRVPFLDHRLVEWTLNQPSEVLIQKGWTKYPIRKALENKGLGSLAWRKDKLGFVVPQKLWRDELLSQLRQNWRHLELDEVFDLEKVKELLDNPVLSNSAQSEFWRIYGLLRWIEKFKVQLR